METGFHFHIVLLHFGAPVPIVPPIIDRDQFAHSHIQIHMLICTYSSALDRWMSIPGPFLVLLQTSNIVM